MNTKPKDDLPPDEWTVASAGFMAGIFQSVANVFSGSVLSPPGPGLYGPPFRLLPQQIRDHWQDLYIAALTPH